MVVGDGGSGAGHRWDQETYETHASEERIVLAPVIDDSAYAAPPTSPEGTLFKDHAFGVGPRRISEDKDDDAKQSLQLCLVRVAKDTGEKELAGFVIDDGK